MVFVELSVLSLLLQDCDDSNPLIRALAVRTMGCIRVDKITGRDSVCSPCPVSDTRGVRESEHRGF